MKLVVRQYLASLKERGELDSLLPDLLSQIGLEVFLKPGIGSRQYGVDVGAFGRLADDIESKVYLFSVKSGDLDRKDWSSGNPQDLRPSIEEIIDVFIPTRIPVEYKDKPIEICLCFGGEVKEEVRANVSMFLEKHKTDSVSFSEWNGDRLATLIEQHMLREELLPKNCRVLLRKSLAMIDEPEISFKHFKMLAASLTNVKESKPNQILTRIRQLNLCLWILYSWCREQNNLESAFLSSEFTILNSWDATKFAFDKKNKIAIETLNALDSIFRLNLQISSQYIEDKILPHVDNLYALSHAVRPSCPVDVNLKMFDLLGRISLYGFWLYWFSSNSEPNSELSKEFEESILKTQNAIKRLVVNNPILFTPYKDEQAIDLTLALFFLYMNSTHWNDISSWLLYMTQGIHHLFHQNDSYPTTILSYAELIEHPIDNSNEYKRSVTKGAVLYPYISLFSIITNNIQPYDNVKKIKEEFLSHCNFQVFFLDESSEKHFYKYDSMHGSTLSHVCIDDTPENFIKQLIDECASSNKIYEMSAYKHNFWPLILTGCRHYRLPIPMHFIIDAYKQIS